VRSLLGGGSSSGSSAAIDTLATLEEDTELSREQFAKLLETIDSGLRALPATAQARGCRVCVCAGVPAPLLPVTSRGCRAACGVPLSAACP
jgi:hypothetical protein